MSKVCMLILNLPLLYKPFFFKFLCNHCFSKPNPLRNVNAHLVIYLK